MERVKKGSQSIALFSLAVLLLAGVIWAQTGTGFIVGSVADPSNLPVSGASVTLVQARTGASRWARPRRKSRR